MAKTTTKARKATPPATTPTSPIMKPHEMLLSSPVQGGVGIHAWSKFMGEVELVELINGLRDGVDRVLDGDMQPVEAMLYTQAMTLQTIFTSLARKAVAQEYLKQFQVNLTLALKAQAQCRATLEALAEIKNPRPVAFVKQANFAQQQQVNNGASGENRAVRAGAPAPAEENPGLQNELLEQRHGNHLDFGTAGTAGGADPHLEAVDAGHRAAHP